MRECIILVARAVGANDVIVYDRSFFFFFWFLVVGINDDSCDNSCGCC